MLEALVAGRSGAGRWRRFCRGGGQERRPWHARLPAAAGDSAGRRELRAAAVREGAPLCVLQWLVEQGAALAVSEAQGILGEFRDGRYSKKLEPLGA